MEGAGGFVLYRVVVIGSQVFLFQKVEVRFATPSVRRQKKAGASVPDAGSSGWSRAEESAFAGLEGATVVSPEVVHFCHHLATAVERRTVQQIQSELLIVVVVFAILVCIALLYLFVRGVLGSLSRGGCIISDFLCILIFWFCFRFHRACSESGKLFGSSKDKEIQPSKFAASTDVVAESYLCRFSSTAVFINETLRWDAMAVASSRVTLSRKNNGSWTWYIGFTWGFLYITSLFMVLIARQVEEIRSRPFEDLGGEFPFPEDMLPKHESRFQSATDDSRFVPQGCVTLFRRSYLLNSNYYE